MSSLVRFAVAGVFAVTAFSRAFAVAPEIRDDAKLFEAETVKKANDQLREIFSRFGRDFLMETFAGVPADQAEKVKGMGPKERSQFFIKWAVNRSNERVVNGVYVLFCKQPEFLVVGITQKARSILDSQARKRIDEILRMSIGEKKPDEGLQAAIKFTREKLSTSR